MVLLDDVWTWRFVLNHALAFSDKVNSPSLERDVALAEDYCEFADNEDFSRILS